MGNTSSTVPSNTPSPVTTNNTIPSSSSSLPIPSVVQQQPPNINSITDSSTSSPSSTFVFPEPVTGNKDDARLQRLKRPNSIKEKLFHEWSRQCFKECDMDVRRYWICRQEHGLLTPFKCRSENQLMKDCLQACGEDEEKYALYRSKRLDELEAEYFARQTEKAKNLKE